MTQLQTIARAVRPAVDNLDALLVPLSGTFKDSEGKYVLTYEEARNELAMRLREASAAIGEALEVLR